MRDVVIDLDNYRADGLGVVVVANGKQYRLRSWGYGELWVGPTEAYNGSYPWPVRKVRSANPHQSDLSYPMRGIVLGFYIQHTDEHLTVRERDGMDLYHDGEG